MALTSTSRPAIRGRVLTKLPATLRAIGGIAVTKQNGVWTIYPDFSALAAILGSAVSDPTSKQVWIFDPVSQDYNVLTLAGLGDALFKATSTSSLAISTGSKTFVTQSGKNFDVGSFVLATSEADPTNFLLGQITSYSGTSLVVSVTTIGGSGTKADWTIRASASAGSAGRSAGYSYLWNTDTASSDPGSGKVKANHATFGSITAVRISETDNDGNGLAAALATWDDVSSPIKGRLTLYDPVMPTNFMIFDATALSDDGAYDTLTVTPIVTGGAFGNNGALRVTFAPKGDKGDTGPTGAPAGFIQAYDNATADADPGNGEFRLNHATPASATAAYLDNLDASGATVAGLIDLFDDSTNTIKGTLRFAKVGAPGTWAEFEVTASVVDGTGYRKLTLQSGAGSGAFTNGDQFSITFARAGNKGADGAGAGDVSAAANFGADNRLIRSDGTLKGVQASGVTLDDSNNMSGVGKVTSEINDAANNAITRGLKLSHKTSGSAASGIGSGIEVELETATGENYETVAAIDFVSTDVANGSEDVDFVVKLMAAGAAIAEKLRIASTGVVTLLGDAAKVVLHAAGGQTLTGGFSATVFDAGTKSTGTYTPAPADGNFQRAINGGAHTLAPPSSDCTIVVQYTNNGSAGAITTSGFTKKTGDTVSTTNGDDFLFFITKLNGFSHLHVQVLQ